MWIAEIFSLLFSNLMIINHIYVDQKGLQFERISDCQLKITAGDNVVILTCPWLHPAQ